jgi:hypothetical protein
MALGFNYSHLGMYDKALDVMQKAYKIKPEKEVYHWIDELKKGKPIYPSM